MREITGRLPSCSRSPLPGLDLTGSEKNIFGQVDREPNIVERIRRSEERVHIAIGAICNNNCVFCMEEDRDGRYNSAMTAERVRWVLESHRGAEEVCFTSGEPTTRDDLPGFIALARELGYPRISLMTNGRRLGHLPYAAALAKRGLGRVYISIHGHEQALHEGLTRTPQSFEQTVAGLRSVAKLAAFGVELHTSTVVTKRNLPHLGAIYRFLRGLGVHQVVFNVMQANGRAHTHFERLFPRYTEIAAEVARMLATLSEAQPMAFLVDIPLCTTEAVPDRARGYVEKHRHYDLDTGTGPEERRASGKGTGLALWTRADLDRAQREKRDECRRCRYDAVCEGVWKNYLARYGWDEMEPVPGASAAQ